MEKDSLKQKTYMLANSDAEIIENLAKVNGLTSLSSAIRMIIREWASMKAGMVTIPKAGIIQEDGKVIIDPKYWGSDEGVDQSR